MTAAMEPHDNDHADDEPAPIRGRSDTGGAWSVVGPLLALGMIGLMIVQSCMPSNAPSPMAPTKATGSR